MTKSKKKKFPRIDPRTLARPRLDALFERHERGEFDVARLWTEVQTLMAEVSHRRALDALLKRLETVPASEQDALLSGLEALHAPGVITYLWQQAKHSGVSAPARVVSLRLLRALGEEAEPDHPEQYLPRPSELAKPSKGGPVFPVEPPAPRSPEQVAADERWEQFEAATLDGKIGRFESALNSGALDDFDEAYEMLNTIRDGLDPRRNPANRERYAQLVEQLRQAAPVLYRQSAGYYLENLIDDAIDDGRWQALPDLLMRFAADAPDDVDTFFRLEGALLYYGQTRPMLAAMREMRAKVATSAKLIPGAGDEFAGNALLWAFYDYVHTSATPRADDPALGAVETEWGEFNQDWLQRAIRHLTTTTTWTPANFGEAVDAEQWQNNLAGLLFDFMAELHARGVPFSQTEMARAIWFDVLHHQMTGGQPLSRPVGKKGKRAMARRAPAAHHRSSSLVPERRELDRACAGRMTFLSPEPYHLAAALEFLPDYLHFIARRGLLAKPDLEESLSALKPLAQQVETLLTNYGGDPRLPTNVAAAWESLRLAEFSADPAVPEAIVAPPPAPALPQPHPGALLTYAFKITYERDSEIWRTVELTSTQTLRELHAVIQDAFEFDHDHLYSFFMSGRAWDKASEYAAQPEGNQRAVSGTRLENLRLRLKQRFLYLFDYGDEHHFDVQLVSLNPDAPKGRYPRIVEEHGQAPQQYGGWDGDDEEDSDDWEENGDE